MRDCWKKCGSRGGKCPAYCGTGHCCSGRRLDLNGDCPSNAIKFIRRTISAKILATGIHVCVSMNNDKKNKKKHKKDKKKDKGKKCKNSSRPRILQSNLRSY